MRDFLVYLSGPISGLTYEEGQSWREDAAKRFHPAIKTLSPLRGKGINLARVGKIENSYEENPLTSAKGILGRDRFDCTRADAILVYLKGYDRISIGTVMEIAWADLNRIPIILVMEKIGNKHSHVMLTGCITYWVETLEEGIACTEALLLPDQITARVTPSLGEIYAANG